MTIEQKRRELFEAWWRVHKGHGEIPARYAGGQYIRDSALWAWIGFNAALDAVVIELPDKFEDNHGGDSHGPGMYDQAIQDCADSIESTGLGLKVLP